MKDTVAQGGTNRYTGVAMFFHWLIAALMIVNVVLALSADSLPEGWERPFINTHKSIGITVLGLALLRLLWRFANPPPPLPARYPKWEKVSAHAAHYALYAVMLALPLSGWIHDSAWKRAAQNPLLLYGVIPWPRISYFMDLDPQTKEMAHKVFGQIHGSLAYVLYALFALHLAGALKHQFIDKEPELQRMLPGTKKMG
jgi:cytochrome b561